MTEVVSKNYAKSGQLVEDITFEEFIKSYVNHRPVFGVSMGEVKKAFAAFTEPEMESNPSITRETFVKILTDYGNSRSVISIPINVIIVANSFHPRGLHESRAGAPCPRPTCPWQGTLGKRSRRDKLFLFTTGKLLDILIEIFE